MVSPYVSYRFDHMCRQMLMQDLNSFERRRKPSVYVDILLDHATKIVESEKLVHVNHFSIQR
jgi:hypothetical protein